MPNLNTDATRRLLQDFRFGEVFISELGWSAPGARKPQRLTVGEPAQAFTLQEISQLAGFRVFEVVSADGTIPDPKTQLNSFLIRQGLPQPERLRTLNEIAITQMRTLLSASSVQRLK